MASSGSLSVDGETGRRAWVAPALGVLARDAAGRDGDAWLCAGWLGGLDPAGSSSPAVGVSLADAEVTAPSDDCPIAACAREAGAGDAGSSEGWAVVASGEGSTVEGSPAVDPWSEELAASTVVRDCGAAVVESAPAFTSSGSSRSSNRNGCAGGFGSWGSPASATRGAGFLLALSGSTSTKAAVAVEHGGGKRRSAVLLPKSEHLFKFGGLERASCAEKLARCSTQDIAKLCVRSARRLLHRR